MMGHKICFYDKNMENYPCYHFLSAALSLIKMFIVSLHIETVNLNTYISSFIRRIFFFSKLFQKPGNCKFEYNISSVIRRIFFFSKQF